MNQVRKKFILDLLKEFGNGFKKPEPDPETAAQNMANLLEIFESKIRQDQKEKCVEAIDVLGGVDNLMIIQRIMEA